MASENHYRFLREAAEDAGVIPLGYIPKTKLLEVPSRHLGSHSVSCRSWMRSPEDVAALIEKHVDVDRLLELVCALAPALPTEEAVPTSAPGRKIAVARDEAFNFIYEENIRALAAQGRSVLLLPAQG